MHTIVLTEAQGAVDESGTLILTDGRESRCFTIVEDSDTALVAGQNIVTITQRCKHNEAMICVELPGVAHKSHAAMRYAYGLFPAK